MAEAKREIVEEKQQPRYFRERAATLRRTAAGLSEETKRVLLQVADNYELMADQIEAGKPSKEG